VFVRNIRHACAAFAPHGVRVMIEPINTRDMPGYFLTTPEQAARIIARVHAPNLALQFDLYHAQIMVGDLATRLRKHFPLIGHVQIAGVPERHEPDTGEVNHPYLFRLLDHLGYEGWVGCEYRAARGAEPGGTSSGLGWLRRC
jgi:hydroxypyruvate isomerase